MSYFGGRRDPKQAAREAIVGLRQQLQLLEKKEEHLQKKIDEEMKKARANAVSNKPGQSSLTSSNLAQILGALPLTLLCFTYFTPRPVLNLPPIFQHSVSPNTNMRKQPQQQLSNARRLRKQNSTV